MIRPFLALVVALTAVSSAGAAEVEFERDPSLPIVNINVAVKAGTTTDPAGQSGVTNFMGEMLLRGTRRRTKEQIDIALDQMGAELSVETRAEAMILRGAVLSAQLKPFLDLVAEILTEPSFPDVEIRKLKGEIDSSILEELGRDAALAARRFNQQLFRGHPYGKPVLGVVKDIDKLNRAKLVAHYNRLVRDKYLLVVGSGDAAPEQVRDWTVRLGKTRLASPEAKAAADLPRVEAPKDPPGRRLVIVDKPDRTQTQIYMGQIGMRMTDPKYFATYLGNYAFGGHSFSSRLMDEIRVKTGWSYGAYSNFRMGLQPRSWSVYLFPQDKVTPAAVGKVLAMMDEVKRGGFSRDEFDFARTSLINGAGFMYNTPRKRVENRLLERTLDLPDGFMRTYAPQLAKVELGDVNAAMREFLHPEHLTTVLVGTASALREPLAKAAGIAPGKIEVTPYTQE